MPVDTQNTDYANNISVWELVRDCDEGATAIKKRPNKNSLFAGGISSTKGTAYLPAPNASDGGSGSTSNQPRSRTQESTDRIVTGASDTLTNEISQGVNQAIRDVFD